MKNQALYTKYRPQTFEQVINQDIVVDFLQKSIVNDRVNHFYIFSGNKGTGKTTTARIFSKTLNCEKKGIEPCNECNACLSNVNVFELDAASNNGVDNIRLIIEKSHQVNLNGNYKIFIIDEAHMLTKSAFNAMLKTLEESSDGNVFILATTEIEKIPDTIISRAINLYFNNITSESIENLIKDISQKEQYEIDDQSIKIISQSSNNAARNALVNLQKSAIYCENSITKEKVSRLFQIADDSLISKLYNNIINSSVNLEYWTSELAFIQTRFYYFIEQLLDVSIKKNNNEFYKYLMKIYDIYLNSKNIDLTLKMILNYQRETTTVNFGENVVNNVIEKKVQIQQVVDVQHDVIEIKDILDKATKEDKIIWSKRWLQNSTLIKEKRFISIILILLESEVVAASKNGIIIVVNKDYAVEKLNKNIIVLKELLKYYSGYNTSCIVLHRENWLEERTSYLENKNKKTEKKSVKSVFGSDFVEEI